MLTVSSSFSSFECYEIFHMQISHRNTPDIDLWQYTGKGGISRFHRFMIKFNYSCVNFKKQIDSIYICDYLIVL